MIDVDLNELSEGGKGGDYIRETCVIPKGNELCRLVSVIEMGHHIPVFNKRPRTYEPPSKRAGEVKDPEMMIMCIFEFTEAKYTGNFPLTIKTSSPFGKDGDLINKLSISKGLEEGWVSRAIALKSNYVKTLMAMQDSHPDVEGKNLGAFVGRCFFGDVTHVFGKKADDEGNIPVYANMKPYTLTAPQETIRRTGKTEVYELPEPIGTYCPVFSWGNPTMDAWTKIPEYVQKYILTAVDYPGSALEMMLASYTEDGADPDEAAKEEYAATGTVDGEEIPDDGIPY